MRGERVSCLRTEGSPSFNSIDLWEPESLTVHDTSSWCWWCDPWHKYCVTSPDRDRQSSHPAPPCWSWLQGVTANHLSDLFVLRMFINEPQQQRGQWRSGGQEEPGPVFLYLDGRYESQDCRPLKSQGQDQHWQELHLNTPSPSFSYSCDLLLSTPATRPRSLQRVEWELSDIWPAVQDRLSVCWLLSSSLWS